MDSTKAISEYLYFLFWKATRCIKVLPTNLFSNLRFLHGGNDFQSSYITFDIFNNSTFFGKIEKANEK